MRWEFKRNKTIKDSGNIGRLPQDTQRAKDIMVFGYRANTSKRPTSHIYNPT